MKLIHLSDLHLGKRVNEFSMLEDQAYILMMILNVIDAEQPDAVLIAGDVYDKSVPSAEAVELFDDFLVKLASRSFRGRQLRIFVISGNHDSPERLAFGGRLMDARGVHLAPVYSGSVTPIALSDSFGPVNIYMLPFVKPAHVRRFFPDARIESYTDAIATAVRAMGIDTAVHYGLFYVKTSIVLCYQYTFHPIRIDNSGRIEGRNRRNNSRCHQSR